MLGKSIPIWLVLLILLFGVLGTVVFGWLVRDTLVGQGRSGAVGEAAVTVATFPTTTVQVLRQLQGSLSGDFADTWLSVRRPRGLDMTGLTPVPAGDSGIDGLMIRRPGGDAIVPAQGWRVMAGSFDLGAGAQNAILLLTPELEIARVIPVDEQGVDGAEPQPPHRKFVHGLEVLDDGSMIFAFDGGDTLQRIDTCGARIWARPGRFSHTVNLAPGGDSIWAVEGNGFTQVDVETGETLKQISVADIMAANPEIDILGLRAVLSNDVTGNSRNTPGDWSYDPHHFNDVDPLPAELAALYPDFAPGDLLISARSLNLVFILDPETLAVRWWRLGTQTRQHDPDWRSDGRISIYDNRMGRDYSRVIALTPTPGGSEEALGEVLLDGRDMDFYSRIRGKHQDLGESIIVTAPQQGRAFEWVPGQGMALEFFNLNPSDDSRNFLISELYLVADGVFDAGLPACAS